MILRSHRGDKKWRHIVPILLGPPFPLMGKGRDRGSREPIKPITPTFILPRRGEGIRALPPVGSIMSRTVAPSKINFSKEIAKATKGSDTFNYKLRAPFDFAQGMLPVLRGQICLYRLALFWLGLCRARFSVVKYVFFGLVLFVSPIFPSSAVALEVPALNATINDFAKMMRPASVDDLTERLRRTKTQSAYTVAVLTMPSLEDEDIESFGRKAFKNLPLTEKELQRSALLIVARKEQKVGLQTGSELQPLFPQPETNRKLQAQVEVYFNGLRPDLGIHAGVHYIFGVIKGEFRVDGASEDEKLEDESKRGAGAGAIFAVLIGPFLAFFVGMLWGIYATHYGVRRETRLFIGAVLGGGTAKIVATLMSMMGNYSDGLWYFILAVSIPLGVFGSLTEYWMGGDWSGIPRVKDKVRRKPEDNMGI